MRRPGKAGGLLILLCVASAGCLTPGATGTRSAAWLDRFRGQAGPDGGLALRTTLIERPAGDPFLSKGLWDSASKPLPHELTTLLAQNGLRVGILTGMVPGEFDRLITSETATISPTQRSFQPNQTRVIPVNGPLERCTYRVLHDLAADPAPVELLAAECGLAVTVQPAGPGRVKLLCEPQVQHGEKQAWLKPTDDGTGFTRRDAKPLAAYPTLAFEVTLGPSDYLVIGPSADPAGTMGQAFFFAAAEDRLRQRVLVVRALGAPASSDVGKPTPTPR